MNDTIRGLTSAVARQSACREPAAAGLGLFSQVCPIVERGTSSLVGGGRRLGFYPRISKPAGPFERGPG